jgi:hypothetical protein
VHNHWLLSAGLAIGVATSLQAQGLRIDPGTVRSRAALRLADWAAPASRPIALRIPSDTTPRPHRSRLASAGLGFAAGAAAGLVVACFVDRTQRTGAWVTDVPAASGADAQKEPDQPSPAPPGTAMIAGGLIRKIRHRPDASFAEVIPSSAPAVTSVSQCRLSLILDQATAVAMP